MHTYGNAHECITCTKCMIMQQRMEMHRIIDALKCIQMHQILNALWCNKCNAGKCSVMHRARMQLTWIPITTTRRSADKAEAQAPRLTTENARIRASLQFASRPIWSPALLRYGPVRQKTTFLLSTSNRWRMHHVHQMHDNAAEDGNSSYHRCIKFKMHSNAPDSESIVMQQM